MALKFDIRNILNLGFLFKGLELVRLCMRDPGTSRKRRKEIESVN